MPSQELRELEEAAIERETRGGEQEVEVLPRLPEYRVGYRDRQGQLQHGMLLANQTKGRDAKRKLLMGRRLAPQDVLEKV